MKLSHPQICIMIAGLLMVTVSACGPAEIGSHRRDRDITIDGVDEGPEWEYARYFLDKQQITLGIMNDDESLYLRLSSRDTAVQRQVLLAGLTIRFDDTGGRTDTFGVRFPLGVRNDELDDIPAMPQPLPTSSGRRGGPRSSVVPTDAIEEAVNGMLAAAGDGVGIIIPGRDILRMGRDEARGYGIEYGIAYDAGNLVYELRVPLHRRDGNCGGITGDRDAGAIDIGFETGEMPEEAESLQDMPDDGSIDDNDDSVNDGIIRNTGGRRYSGDIERYGLPAGRFPAETARPLEFWLRTYLAKE